MFLPAVTVALSKATTPMERAALAVVLDRARELDIVESAFDPIARIGARHYDSPELVEPSAAQREALARERAEAEAEKLTELQDLPSSISVIRKLHSALASDIAFWKMASSNSPPAALEILQTIIATKEQLRVAFERYISAHAHDA